MRRFRQLTKTDRIKIEALLKAGHSKNEIAEQLHVHRSTIYRELKRGVFTALNSDLTTEERYSPDIADARYKENLKSKGGCLKIGNDIKLANYIEDKIVNDDYSPAAVIGELKLKGDESGFETMICVTTLYSYIDKGIFLKLTNKNLPVKKNRKRVYRKVKKVQSRDNAGESIEKRPDEVNKRQEFGHWEMDSVLGKRGESKNTLLTLTERKTRAEIIFKLPDGTADSVVSAIDRLEVKWGMMFRKVFKSITVDNGHEFAYCAEMERSVFNPEEKRTHIYYCHPYSSWERGTNEVTNKMVRRKVPKGSNFDDKTEEDIIEIEKWINNYPRRIHGYHTAAEMLDMELAKII